MAQSVWNLTAFVLLLLLLLQLLRADMAEAGAIPAGWQLQRTDAQRVIDAIPADDRAYFVTYHLAKEAKQQGRLDVSVVPGLDAIPTENFADLQDIPVPTDFGRNLLSWAEREVLSARGPVFYVERRNNGNLEVCFPSGCVDPNEIGTNCCPF